MFRRSDMTMTFLKATILTAAVLVSGACASSNERESAQPAPSGSMHLVLVTSADRLEVYRGGALEKTYTVSVGRPGYATPSGSYAISEIVWNPSWNPPNSGWAAGKSPKGPGEPGNPMGRVKMMFSDEYYIHGTSDVGQLGEPVSHGCVRMSNADAVELAKMVQDYGRGGGEDEGTVRLHAPVPLEVR
jgi:lipoprotein-anchoring transpeptidase ErfK/SrfK